MDDLEEDVVLSSPLLAHRPRGRRSTGALAALLAAALVLSACSSLSGGQAQNQTPASGGSLSQIDLKGQTYSVGGKNFDEQLVLCAMSVAALQAAGATVNNRCNFPGTNQARGALTSGEIDHYWEYTGTGWVTHLQFPAGIPDPQQQYIATRDEDLRRNNLVWLPPAPFNNTYAFAVNQANAQRLGVKTIDDMARIVSSGSPDGTVCVESELQGRPDGIPGLQKAYNFQIPPDKLKVLDTGPIYQATANANPCVFGEVFTTDGRIKGLNLQLLADTKGFFPNYNASPVWRKETFDRNPRVAEVFAQITSRLSFETMSTLNTEQSVQGKPADQVARDWLKSQGLIANG